MDDSSMLLPPLFANLPAEDREYLLHHLRRLELTRGSMLFREGEPGEHFYIVLQGTIEVLKVDDAQREHLLAVRQAGELVGEMSLVEAHGQRSASGRVGDDAVLIELTRADFEYLFRRSPQLAFELIRALSGRLRETSEKTIHDLQQKNDELLRINQQLQAAQAQLVEKGRIEHELQLARSIQERMLPRRLPNLPGYQFAVAMQPAQVVSGDFYDLFPLGEGYVGIAVGDICGKGLSAALIMALTRSVLRVEGQRTRQPEEALQRTNSHILDVVDGGMFVTLLYGILEQQSGQFRYARAGHEQPTIVTAQGVVRVPELGLGMPLGILAEPAIDTQTLTLAEGETLALFSDGLTEANDPNGELFGSPRVYALLEREAMQPAAGIRDQLLAAVACHQGDQPAHDDLTLLLVQREA